MTTKAEIHRTLVGVDAGGLYRKAIGVLGRLDIPSTKLMLMHIGEPVLSAGLLAPQSIVEEIGTQWGRQAQSAELLLSEAESEAFIVGLGNGTEVVYWPEDVARPADPGDRLIRFAKQREVDLIAVGSGQKGTAESFLSGSVGQSLAAHSDRSFLVARGKASQKGLIRAIFATDFSTYAEQSFARLLELAPAGIGEIHIVCASEGNEEIVQRLPESDWGSAVNLGEAIRREGQQWVGRAKKSGYMASFRLDQGTATEVIARTMQQTQSELLILGAKGHGFVERLLLGSVAYHEVAHSPYSVWVIRLP